MASVFLRDWKAGDVVTADDLNELAAAVAMVEAVSPASAAARGVRHQRSVEDDGPAGMPWEVYAGASAGGLGLFVVPGRVLCGFGGHGDGDDELEWVRLAEDAVMVEDFEVPAPGRCVTVYLEMRGAVEVRRLRVDELAEEDAWLAGRQFVALKDVVLRCTCKPDSEVLRVWPLAVYTPGHEQPLTQLLWGDLSALECRALVDAAGEPVWPSDRSQAGAWGTEAHGDGMTVLCAVDFSTRQERIEGALRGCVALDGALELYAGKMPRLSAGGGNEGGGDVWPDDPEDDGGDDGGGGGGGGYSPVEPGGGDTFVRYGYMAGPGFSACTLTTGRDGRLYWELTLDGAYLVRLCAGLKAAATVTFAGDGVQEGTWRPVEMGLGACRLDALGPGMTGEVGLVFGEVDAEEVGKKTSILRLNFEGNPVWSQEKRWYLSPKFVHQAGRYVVCEEGRNGLQPGGFVKAAKWYRWRIDAAAFRAAAEDYFRREMGRVSVADSNTATSFDSTVTGTLTGTLLNARFDLVLD